MHCAIRLLFLLTSLSSFAAQAAENDYVGKVAEISKDKLVLDSASGRAYIGFVAEEDALSSLEKINAGDQVRAVFGSTIGPHGRRIGTLLSIRVCLPNDGECEATRAKNDSENATRLKAFAARQEKSALCYAAMDATLAQDTRYVPKPADAQSEARRIGPNTLSEEQGACVRAFVNQHYAAYSEACRLHRCGDGIGGGCAHLAGRIGHSGIRKKAVEKCTSAPK